MNIRDEVRQEAASWSAGTFYQNFERLVVYVLTTLVAIVIATATWRLAHTIIALVLTVGIDPTAYDVFQAVFGAVFTVLIALEFKHSLLVTIHRSGGVVQVRSVVLIALLALVRKFIILDVKTAAPAMVASLAVATLSLGLVYWLVREGSD